MIPPIEVKVIVRINIVHIHVMHINISLSTPRTYTSLPTRILISIDIKNIKNIIRSPIFDGLISHYFYRLMQ